MSKKYKIQVSHSSDQTNQIFNLISHGQKSIFLERAIIFYATHLLQNNKEALHALINEPAALESILKNEYIEIQKNEENDEEEKEEMVKKSKNKNTKQSEQVEEPIEKSRNISM